LISLDDAITGLVPISEFGGKKPSEVLQIGDEQETTIVSFDPKEHKMLLKLNKKSSETPITQIEDTVNEETVPKKITSE